MKRILDCRASDFRNFGRNELKQSIMAAEGRTVIAETVAKAEPLYPEITNAELMKAFGADMILLNVFDVFNPEIKGLTASSVFNDADAGKAEGNPVAILKSLVGLPIGVNLEPVDESAERLEALSPIAPGRQASIASLKKADELGFDFVCLTGNPKTGVTNEAIEASVKHAAEHFKGVIIAGKMHSAGTAGNMLDLASLTRFAEAGADIILFPAPGTVPGIREDMLAEAVSAVKSKGALAMAAIGTSQEGADSETIRSIALSAKRAGVDIVHIGDAGYTGIAVPENIQSLSIAIRGRRHTYIRMASSVNR